jgi:hypothetical protein
MYLIVATVPYFEHTAPRKYLLSLVLTGSYLFDYNSFLGHWYHNGVNVGTRPPVVGSDGGYVRRGVGVKVLLEELRLPGHREGDHLEETIQDTFTKKVREKSGPNGFYKHNQSLKIQKFYIFGIKILLWRASKHEKVFGFKKFHKL